MKEKSTLKDVANNYLTHTKEKRWNYTGCIGDNDCSDTNTSRGYC